MKRKRFKKFFKRLCALLTAMMILFFTGLDCYIYKPMQAYAAAVALPAWLGGAAGSVFADLFYSFGIGKTTFDTSSTYALAQNFKDYAEEKKSSYDTSTEEDLSKLLEPIGYMTDTGQLRTYDLSAKDVYDSSSFIDTLKDKTEATIAVPKAFLNTMRAFCVQKLNFNAVDGSPATTTIQISPERFFDLNFKRLSFPIKRSSTVTILSASGPVWAYSEYDSTRTRRVRYIVKTGTTLTVLNLSTGVQSTYLFTDYVSKSGYYACEFHNIASDSIVDKSVCPFFPSGYRPSDVSDKLSYNLYVSTSNPSIDVGYADADAITWQGTPDLEQTLANQTQAATDGKREEYVNNTITTANIDQALSYNALNYILDTIAGHYGVEVDSATKDEFIASVYADYVQGSSAEKMEQADEVMKKFVVINGTGGNNNKHFTVLDAVVSAYVTALILKHILPEGTAAPAPETEIENVKVVQQLPEPDPGTDPTPGTDPDPGGDQEPDISLSGILSRLGKILDAILSLPQKIYSEFKSGIQTLGDNIAALPEAFAASRLGQWIQSIPQGLQNIQAQIETIPDTLIEIKNAIAAVPGAIVDFFTVDAAQVNAAYHAMTDTFKGKFSALEQITGILNKTDYNFSDTIPVIKMQTPDILKYAVNSDEIVIMDLTPYADIFQWCRTILAAIMWIAFAHWGISQFDVKFHVG